MKGAVLDPRRLHRALAVRGLTAEQFRALAGLSRSTMASLAGGRLVHPRTLRRVASTLAAVPPLAGLDVLLAGDPETSTP